MDKYEEVYLTVGWDSLEDRFNGKLLMRLGTSCPGTFSRENEGGV